MSDYLERLRALPIGPFEYHANIPASASTASTGSVWIRDGERLRMVGHKPPTTEAHALVDLARLWPLLLDVVEAAERYRAGELSDPFDFDLVAQGRGEIFEALATLRKEAP